MRTYKCLLLFSLVISNGFCGCCGGGKENNSSGKENNGSGSGKDTIYKGLEKEVGFSYGDSDESIKFDDYDEVNSFNDLISKDIFVSPGVLETLGFSKSKNGFKNSNNINVFGFCKDVYEKIFSTEAIFNTISTKNGNEKINDENKNSSEKNEDDTKSEKYKKIEKTNTTKENILESVFETLSCHCAIKYDKDKIGIKAIEAIIGEGKKLVEEKEVIEKKKQSYLEERKNILKEINKNTLQKNSSNNVEIKDNTRELDSEKEELDSKMKEVNKKLTKIHSERDEFFKSYTRSLKDLFKRSGFDGVINYFSFYLCGGNLSNVEIDAIKSFLKYIFGLKIPSDIDFRIEKSNDGSGEYLLILSDSVYSLIQNLLESTYLTNDRHLNSIVSVIMKCISHNKNSNKSSDPADELSNKENKEEIDKSKDGNNAENKKQEYSVSFVQKNAEEEEEDDDDDDEKKAIKDRVKKNRVKKEKEEEKKNFVYIKDIDGYFIKDDNKKILIPIKDMVKLSCNFLRYYLKNFTSSFNIGGVGYKCIHIKTSLLDGKYKELRDFVVKYFGEDRVVEKPKNSAENDNKACEKAKNNVENENNNESSYQKIIQLNSSSDKIKEKEFNKDTKKKEKNTKKIEKNTEVKDSKDFKGLFDKIKGKLEILLNECGLFNLLKIKDDLLVLMKSCGLFDLFRKLYDVFDIVAEGSLLAEERYNLKSCKKNGKISDFFHRRERSSESTEGEGGEYEECRNLRMNFLADFFSMPKGILVKKIKSMNFVSFLKFMLGRFNNFSENLENFLSKDYFKDIFKIGKIKLERKTESTTEVVSKEGHMGEIKFAK